MMDTFEILRNIALPSWKRAESDRFDEGNLRRKCISDENACTKEANDGNDSIGFECLEYSSHHLEAEHQSDETLSLHDETNLSKFYEYTSSIRSLDTTKLNKFLIKLDEKYRTFIDDARTREVVSATEDLIATILNTIGNIDPRFKSKCIKSGSFYDGVKIGQADEFDFVAKIESLSRRNILEARESKRKKGFVYVVVKDEDTLKTFREFIVTPDNDECLRKDDKVLDVHEFQSYFCELVGAALKQIHIPENFIDSDRVKGKRGSPNTWEPFKHGPCATLRVAYVCQSSSEVVDLDIDIAPSIAYPDENFGPPVLQIMKDRINDNIFIDLLQCISQTEDIMLVPFTFDYIQYNKNSWDYLYSDTWRVSFSSLEKAVFEMYDTCSTEKRLFRSLKVLKEMYLQNSPDTEFKSGSIDLKLKEPPSAFVTSCSVEIVGNSDSEEEETTYNCLQRDTNSNDSDASNDDEDDEGMTSVVTMAHSDKWPNVPSGGSTRKIDSAEEAVDETMSPRELLSKSSRLSLEISDGLPTTFKSPESECKGQKTTGNISWKDNASSVIKLHRKTVRIENGPLTNDSDPNIDIIYQRQPGLYPPDEQYCNQEDITYLRQRMVIPDEAMNILEQPSVRLSKSTEDESSFEKMLNYRTSKPLIKTYVIKMLFFAMKTAYPDDKEWKEDRLSTLLLLAMQMLYYAFCSKEKGFLNFWFQDFIENRTRNSTSLEILHTLEEVVNVFRNV